jgi:FkbM family methyltransferase
MTQATRAIRLAAGTATDLACLAAGRGRVVRASRFVLRRSCLDVPNDLRTNGEASLQQWTLLLSPPGRPVVVVDVGANVGQWSGAMLAAARQAGRLDELNLHAFEPSAYTFARLSEELDGQRVSLHQAAVSDRPGPSTLHVIAPGAGTNSLHLQHAAPAGISTEEVATTTLDGHAEDAGLDHIRLVKIDAEGHDLAVLRGARGLLARQRISIAQFEYNHRWIYSRSFLRDAFVFLEPFGYRLGKLTPRGVEFYPGWDTELETFVEGNYVACAPGIAGQLPAVTWWKWAGGRGPA